MSFILKFKPYHAQLQHHACRIYDQFVASNTYIIQIENVICYEIQFQVQFNIRTNFCYNNVPQFINLLCQIHTKYHNATTIRLSQTLSLCPIYFNPRMPQRMSVCVLWKTLEKVVGWKKRIYHPIVF